jgi:diphosphomevalonate decarboxylase
MDERKIWRVSAPSNIALIKYMGKIEPSSVQAPSAQRSVKDSSVNQPTNTSLSYTLSHLRTWLELELAIEKSGTDSWEPLLETTGPARLAERPNEKSVQQASRPLAKLELSEKGLARFLAHLGALKKDFGFTGSFVVRSANDFPSDCGLASSASSFAALTSAALEALASLTGRPPLSVAQAADWSRRGSGSSCRSFFEPWSIWEAGRIAGVDGLQCNDLIHQVVVVNEDIKTVSSSEAHQRVMTSSLFNGRPSRAHERVTALLASLKNGDWRAAFETSWAEFWDMHALFETSSPSFGYMTAGSLEVLQFVRQDIWARHNDGPLVTMDAGPNVHLLYRRTPATRAFALSVTERFSRKYLVLSSEESTGSKL